MSYKNEGDEATKWFLRHHFRNHGLTVLRYFLKRGFMETLVKAYNICVTVVAQGHRYQLSIPTSSTMSTKKLTDMTDTVRYRSSLSELKNKY